MFKQHYIKCRWWGVMSTVLQNLGKWPIREACENSRCTVFAVRRYTQTGCCRPGSGESRGGITREQWTVQLGYQIVTGTKEVEWLRVRNLQAGTKMKIDGTEEPVTGAHKNHWQDSDRCNSTMMNERQRFEEHCREADHSGVQYTAEIRVDVPRSSYLPNWNALYKLL